MRSLRRLGVALWLAIALLAGQQLVLWHDLGHATESLARADGAGDPADKAPSKCEQHFTCAQLSGALGTSTFAAAFVAATPPRAAVQRMREAALAPRHAFQPRGPPASLA